MPQLLHVDASVRVEGSTSRRLSSYLVEQLEDRDVALTIDRLDLAKAPPPHFGPLETAAMYQPVDEHTAAMRRALARSDALVARVLAADALVVGVPIYNFGAPSAFKAFVDHISRSGLTFTLDSSGLTGHLAGKQVAFLIAAGGNYAPGAMFDGLDCLTPQIRAIFGFLGVAEPDIVQAYPTEFEGPERKAEAIERAQKTIRAIARRWAAVLRA